MRGKLAQPSADTIKDEARKGTRWRPSKTHSHSDGAMIVVRPTSVLPSPNRSYIAPANRGNAGAKVDRRAMLLAIADAAIKRYAVTRRCEHEIDA